MASIQGMADQDEGFWQRLLRGSGQAGPGFTGTATGMAASPEGQARMSREGLISAPFKEYMSGLGESAETWRNRVFSPYEALFLGSGSEGPDASAMIPGEREMDMAAALGMASPAANQRPGSLESFLGFGPKYGEEGAFPEVPEYSFPSGQVAPARKMEQLDPTKYQSFEAARSALGTGPEPVEGPSRMEKLARVLGGAASGARGGLTPGAAQAGSSTAAVLAGAGAGTGEVISRLSREEQMRQREFRARQDRFKAQSASLEARIASSKSDVDRDNAMADRYRLGQNHRAELQRDAMMAPRQFSLGDGRMAMVKTDPETGQVTTTIADLGYNFRWAKIKAYQSAAQRRGKVWLGGNVEIERGSLTPNVLMAVLRAQEYLATGTGKATVYKWLEERKDFDMGQIESQVLSQMLDQGKFDMTLLFATIDMMGEATAEMLADQMSGGQSGPLGISQGGPTDMSQFFSSGQQ